jgi:splicing factor 3B subunit 2
VAAAAAAEGVEIEYVAAPLPFDGAGDAATEEFTAIFRRFEARGGGDPAADAADAAAAAEAAAAGDATAMDADGDGDDDGDEGGEATLSKKKAKALRRMAIGELKQHCRRPEVVEVWDVTAPDPTLLVHLKAYRNSVPVPRHWSQKRKFLAGKRGVEKPPWELPPFLAATGIGKLREAYAAKEEAKSLKGKGRERMTPKMGKIDIDYQLLHDAFFKHQTKPRLTGMGDLYYEGKEFEVQLGSRRPGVLSDDLQAALGMPPGTPPPWLVNMQRYGPPPSYPALRIAGLNAPIPPGAQFGYHPGGWGKPPVDESGNALYGDVFGVAAASAPRLATPFDVPVDRVRRWGALEAAEDASSEDESEDGEGEGDDDEGEGAEGADALEDAEVAAGLASTVSSLPSGVETPADIDLRKGGSAPPRQLYSVLEQRDARVDAGSLMGASHTYVVPPAGEDAPQATTAAARRAAAAAGVRAGGGGSEAVVTLAPEELEAGLDDAQLAARYAAAAAAQAGGQGGGGAKGEDFSDLVAEQASKAKRKADGKGRKDGDAKKFKF